MTEYDYQNVYEKVIETIDAASGAEFLRLAKLVLGSNHPVLPQPNLKAPDGLWMGMAQNRHGGQYYLSTQGGWYKEKYHSPKTLAVFKSYQEAQDAVDRSDEITNAFAARYEGHVFSEAVQADVAERFK